MPQMPVPPMGGFPSIIPRFSVPPPGFPDFPLVLRPQPQPLLLRQGDVSDGWCS
nr:unnamed protein product [Callosobruchus analis]